MELTTEMWDALKGHYGVALADPDVFPKLFAYQVLLWRNYDAPQLQTVLTTE